MGAQHILRASAEYRANSAGDPSNVSGLWTWYKADAIAGKSNTDPISQWDDSSGHSRHATQSTSGNQPTYKTNQINSLPAVGFNPGGIGQFLDLPTLAALTAGTVFVVIRKAADPASSTASSGFWVMGNSGQSSHYPYTDGVIYDGFGTDTRKTVGDPTPSLAAWRLYNVRSAPGSWEAWLDGTSIFSTGTNTVGFSSTPRIGAHTASFLMDGDVAEFILYSAAISAGDRDLVEAYIAAKYGLTIA